jgi:hypothetical protein
MVDPCRIEYNFHSKGGFLSWVGVWSGSWAIVVLLHTELSTKHVGIVLANLSTLKRME